MKENGDFFAEYLYIFFNEAIESSKFPSSLKQANITPVFKRGSRNQKENYRPVNILPIISKIFEKILGKLLYIYFENILSKFQCGFRNGFNTQHCLLLMIEKWKVAADQDQFFGALLTDLSRAFDCFSHDFQVAKLHSYGMSLASLKLLSDYLTNRKQRTKVETSYSSWEDIKHGVPQGFILGPLLFNIFVWDMFLTLDHTYFASYADDNTPCTVNENAGEVIWTLEQISKPLLLWLTDNKMNLNPDKCHSILIRKGERRINVRNVAIKNSRNEKLLGVFFKEKATFGYHIENMCIKVRRKLQALARGAPYMDLSKRKYLVNAFLNSQFSYCTLVWMCHSRALNNKVIGYTKLA